MQKVNKEAKRTSTPGLARQFLPSSLREGARRGRGRIVGEEELHLQPRYCIPGTWVLTQLIQ